MPPPPDLTLTDGRLLLRPYVAADADALTEAALESVSEVYPWLSWCHPGYTRDEAVGWIAACGALWGRGDGYTFAIADARTGRFLGSVGVTHHGPTRVAGNLGYWVRTGAAGQGVATRATRLAARFAVETLALQRVEIIVAGGNVPSLRVAEKAGAVREGVLRNRLVLHGVPTDAVMHSVVPADLVAHR